MSLATFLPQLKRLGSPDFARLKKISRDTWRHILDYLGPPHCLNCLTGDRWLCRSCNLLFGPPPKQCCPGCGTDDPRLSRSGLACSDCRELESPLDQLLCSFLYESRVFHRVLAGFKEDGNVALADLLTDRFVYNCDNLLDINKPTKKDPPKGFLKSTNDHLTSWSPGLKTRSTTMIVPVPASPRRLRLRGFNQSTILAGALSRRLKIPLREDVLFRHNNHSTQKELNRSARRLKLKDIFYLQSRSALQDSEVILVDDVATTLATMETCASLLKTGGAGRVLGCVLSRAY